MRYLALFLLTGCAQIAPSIREPALPVSSQMQVELVNYEVHGCREAFNFSKRYFLAEGKELIESGNAHLQVVCMPDIKWYWRAAYLTLPITRIRGLTFGRVAIVYLKDELNPDSHYMIHELKHLIDKEQHSAKFLPFFIDITG